MSKSISFWVPGVPRPQGSKKIVQPRGHKYPVMIEQSPEKHKAWRLAVSQVADEHVRREGWQMTDDFVRLDVCFVFVRPTSHFNKHGVKRGAPIKPKIFDLDKLVRSVGDSMTSIVYRDDNQTAEIHTGKDWGESGGAWIKVTTIDSADVEETKKRIESEKVSQDERSLKLPGME